MDVSPVRLFIILVGAFEGLQYYILILLTRVLVYVIRTDFSSVIIASCSQ